MTKWIRDLGPRVLCAGFLLGIREGKVALWRDGEGHPFQIYDIRADSLPVSDQLLLRQGIRLENREELWMILEDYLG